MADDVIIKVEGLWKRYGLPLVPAVKGFANRLLGRPSTDGGPWALRDVSFEVRRGETLGIIGRNGAGKSTLLKILAGVTPPTRGRVEVRGRVFPMIELNAGIHMELTGRENVRLLGAIMGLSRREIEAKMPEIEEFCELGEWFDKPVRMYSDGMLARLGFGVAMNVDADILLIDEVLAVGDFAFQAKCYEKIRAIQNEGVTILFVSHNPYQVERLCPHVLFLEDGKSVFLGNARDTVALYHQMCNAAYLKCIKNHDDVSEKPNRQGTGEVRIEKVEVLNSNGDVAETVHTLQDMRIRINLKARKKVTALQIRIDVISSAQVIVNSYMLLSSRTQHKTLYGECSVECRVPKVLLMPGVYTLDVVIKRDVLFDYLPRAASFKVELNDAEALAASDNKGIFYSEAEWVWLL
ncbi:MAG: hypothetical protein DRG40_00215 [Deltaproteobacteria bacterium]|nr:MAG: hypothetical protein DRG40_00215 [Deltaproteobacteria bacterium]